jgi:hypothetical protein
MLVVMMAIGKSFKVKVVGTCHVNKTNVKSDIKIIFGD